MDRRLELEGWISRTRRNQRILAIVLACAAVVAAGVAIWLPRVGAVALAIVAIVAICGFWVTSSHIADWRGKLRELDQPRRTVGRRS
jgi:Flp pilus assembly protein TadB